jgi:DNA-binding protein YbaB
MFDKVKQLGELNKMRSQAKVLQKELEKIKHTEEFKGVRVRVSGDQKVEYIEIDGVENEHLAEAINKALKNVQKKSAKRMMEMGGGISGLLGNL